MADYNRFDNFIGAVHRGEINLETATFAFALTEVAPNGATNEVLTDLTTVPLTNLSGNNALTVTSAGEANGVFSIVVANKQLVASGGAIGPFRYVAVYVSSSPNDTLLCWYDLGENVTIADGDTLNFNFSQANGLYRSSPVA